MTSLNYHSTTTADRAYFVLRDPALKAGAVQRHNCGALAVDRRAAARRNALADSRHD